VDQRISLVTLGVADVSSAAAFYERLGWRRTLDLGETVFFQLGCLVLGLWGRSLLAVDSGVVDAGGWGGVTLAHNVASPDEVDRVIEDAQRAGARISREPAPTPWGGYGGVFVDPDGHPWEVAHSPGFDLGADGSVILPGS